MNKDQYICFRLEFFCRMLKTRCVGANPYSFRRPQSCSTGEARLLPLAIARSCPIFIWAQFGRFKWSSDDLGVPRQRNANRKLGPPAWRPHWRQEEPDTKLR